MNGVALGETFDLVFPMFPHPVFQVAGHACVECSLGFVAHDVERGLSYDCALLWIPAFAGMTGGSAGMTGEA